MPRVAAVALLAPAIAAACWLLWAHLGGAVRVDPYAELTFLQALERNRPERAFELIRAGQDPNAPLAFRHDQLSGGRTVALTPLLIAVALDAEETAAMLISSGAILDRDGNRLALCLARQLGHAKIEALLVRDAGPAATATPCPPVNATDAVLRPYVVADAPITPGTSR